MSSSRALCCLPHQSFYYPCLPSVKKQKHDSKFASLTEQVIEKIVEDKNTQNTKRSATVAKELFADYVKEKKLSEPEEKQKLTQTLKTYILCRSEKERILKV